MPSNFAEVGKRLEEAISVPELPITSIHQRLRDVNSRHRANVLIACAVIAVAMGSGAALAGKMYGGVRIWLSGDKGAIAANAFTFIQNPNADDLRRVVADATFRVVLPAGVPKGMHLNQLAFSPADHPNFVQVSYRNARTDARIGPVFLFDSSTVNHGEAPTLPNGESPISARVTQWTVGNETVVVRSAGNQAEAQAAMSRITPAESLVQTLPMLYRITVLADLDRLADPAEALAPLEGRSVLVAREYLGEIAGLAQSHRSLVRVRATIFESLPTVAGKPDWAHQKNHRSKEVAVSADGVRALATVLATGACGSGRMAAGFTCEMLINERSGQAYRIWVLPLKSSAPSTRYVVDPTTFRVVGGT